MNERESITRTLGVAAGVALFCSVLVSTTVVWLRPTQLAYQSIEQNRAVLEAAGITESNDELSNREVVNRFLAFQSLIVDLDAAAFTDAVDAAGYDYRRAIEDPQQNRDIAPALDNADLGRRPYFMPVYVLYQDSQIDAIVFPVYGKGMWSTIYGFISLGPDIATIAGVSFYEHGETPGIGDRIQNPDWIEQWKDQRVYGEDGQLAFRIGSGALNSNRSSSIDAITGATVTVSAIQRFVTYWLGDDGYGPFFAKLRDEVR